MEPRLAIILTLLLSSALADIRNNKIDDSRTGNKIDDDPNPFAEAAEAFLQDGKAADIGNIIGNFMQSNEGKQLGGMLMGAALNNGGAAQILSGLGSMLNNVGSDQKAGSANNNEGSSFDPSMIMNLVGMMADAAGSGTKDSNKVMNNDDTPDLGNLLNMASTMFQNSGQKSDDQPDIGNMVNMAGAFLQNTGINAQNAAEFLPQILQTINAFTGPEAKQRETEHSNHAWFLPPVAEKAHILFDHFAHSDMGRNIWKSIGIEKLFDAFSKDGKFNFAKFFDQLENQSFRKHWISMLTKKITDFIAFATHPTTHKKYIYTGLSLGNGLLRSAGFPKTAMIDLTRPTETISAMLNHLFKTYFSMKISTKQYVQPVVKYVQDTIALGQTKGMIPKDGVNSTELSNLLTDTINLEIIEPLARVYRAYRFIKRVPECDKYVLCLINQEDPNEFQTIPGLKKSLSKAASLYVSWFLSGKTGTSFWTLYSNVFDEKDCSIRFFDKCNDFHIEEIKVTTEYVHNEL